MFLVLALVAGADPAFTVTNHVPDRFVVTNHVPAAVPAPKSVVVTKVVPPGYHAHRMADGSTMIHADSNNGSSAAHAGVPGYTIGRTTYWDKSATAGQTVTVTQLAVKPSAVVVDVPVATTLALPQSATTCPPGGCQPQRGRLFNWRN